MASLVDVAVVSDDDTGTSRTFTLPTGIVANDVMFFVFPTQSTHALNALGGATQLGTTQAGGTDTSLSVLYQVATGSEGSSITFTDVFSVSENGGAVCFAYSGLDTADIVEAVAQSQTTGTLIQGPETTPATDNCLILQILGEDPNASTYAMTPDAIATEIFDGKTDALDYGYVAVQAYSQTTAAAITLDATMTPSSTYPHFQVALNTSASGDTATVTEGSLTDGGTISGTYTKADQWASSDPDRGTVDNVPLTNFTAAAGVWSADNPDVYSIAEGLTYPATAAVPDFGTVDVVISDVSYDAPAVSKVFNVKSGWAEVTLATVDTVTTEGLYLRINATVTPDRNIATTEKIYYDTVSGDVMVTDDGLYSLDGATNDFDFAVISATNNVDEAFQFRNLGGGGGNVPQTKFRRFPWQPYNPL